jgi:hypothetical protein
VAEVLTILSIVDFDTGFRARIYFGPNPLTQKGAEAELLLMAGDMVRRNTSFTIGGGFCEPGRYAYVDLGESLPIPASKAVIHLCVGLGGFLSLPPLPLPGLRPSMMDTIVHEYSHITSRTLDEVYGCAPSAALAASPAGIGALANADNYACFVAASAIEEAAEVVTTLLE